MTGEVHRQAIAAKLVARTAGARLSARSAEEIRIPVGGAEVVIRLQPVDAVHAIARFEHVSVAYAVRGALGGHAAEARAIVETICAATSELDRESDLPVVRGGPRVTEAMIREAIALHRESVGAWWRPRAIRSRVPLPACLAPELRPPFEPLAPAGMPTLLGAPCSSCSLSASCTFASESDVPSLRPMRHLDRMTAAMAGLESVASAFGAELPPSIRDFVVDRTEAARVMASSGKGRRARPAPFELSLKGIGTSLVRSIRVVEYASGDDASVDRAARNDGIGRLVRRMASAEVRRCYDEWRELASAGPDAALELSIGLDVPLDAPGAATIQVYAHPDPGDRSAGLSLAESMLRWAGASPDAVGSFRALVEASNLADPGGRPSVTLLCFSPSASDARRVKIYVAAPLAFHDAARGLPLEELGRLAPFAPAWGLAVFETELGVLRARKRDFPNVVHHQSEPRIEEAFGAGLDPQDRARLESILDGKRFAAWPTWLSVAGNVRTLYFVPR